MTTDTDLPAAVAHIKRDTIMRDQPWEAADIPVVSETTDPHIATILNAVASGDLVPRADVEGLVGAGKAVVMDYPVAAGTSLSITNPENAGYGSIKRLNAALTAWENRK